MFPSLCGYCAIINPRRVPPHHPAVCNHKLALYLITTPSCVQAITPTPCATPLPNCGQSFLLNFVVISPRCLKSNPQPFASTAPAVCNHNSPLCASDKHLAVVQPTPPLLYTRDRLPAMWMTSAPVVCNPPRCVQNQHHIVCAACPGLHPKSKPLTKSSSKCRTSVSNRKLSA